MVKVPCAFYSDTLFVKDIKFLIQVLLNQNVIIMLPWKVAVHTRRDYDKS